MTRVASRAPDDGDARRWGPLWETLRPASPVETPRSRVAVCHDWFTTLGGADKVAALLSRHFQADLVASFAARPELIDQLEVTGTVVTSRLNRLARLGRRWQAFLPVMPLFWRALDLEGHDVVITSSHATVNAVRTPHALRVCYCHTPMRYAWRWREEQRRLPRPLQFTLPATAAALRRADRRWARHVDVFVANSTTVAERIERYYGRSSQIVHPPIDTDLWTPAARPTSGDFFLVAGRLVGYKRSRRAVRAARAAGARVVVAGDGPDLAAIEQEADAGVTIVRSPDDETLLSLYRDARALLFAGVEDFGMTIVEAQACGTPVVARRAGGALDSVIPGTTGVLVDDGSVAGLSNAIRSFDDAAYDPAAIRRHAEGFGVKRFLEAMERVVNDNR